MLLVWFLCFLWVLSAASECEFSQSPINVSAVLDSLRCYNDYKSHFHCTWREEPERRTNSRLQLCFKKNKRRSECKDQEAAEGTRACRYGTSVFAPGSVYTAYFKDPLNLCPTIKPTHQDLLIRARTPIKLSTSSTEDGGTQITWSSPYPQSLNDDITYRVIYRQHGHIDWTLKELPDTHLKLDKEKLSQGHGYEARVSAQVRLGHWSHWSPTVSWNTRLDPEQAPRVDCVLWGEGEAHCSWEQSTERSHFISYQLVCHPNHTATVQECCQDPEVSLGHKEDTVKFSCRLPLTQSSTTTLRIQLVPKQNSKTFRPMYHIRPYPPTEVNVTEKGSNFVVEWTQAKIGEASGPNALSHEVRYYSHPNEEDARTIFSNQSSVNIPRSSLLSSRRYTVKVRALVVAPYDGTPSDWSHPVHWTPQEDSKNVIDVTWIYTFAAVAVVAAMFATVFIVPVCRRRVVLWANSIPSPDKSKVILDILSVKNLEMMSCEETYICKVVDMDSVSTCSTIVSPWLKKELHTQSEETEDDGIWSCDNLPVSPVNKTPMSFTGPYIFFQPIEVHISEQTEGSCPDVGCPDLSSQSEEDYVRLPGPSVSMSTQDLSSLNHSRTVEQSNRKTEEDTGEKQRRPSNDYVAETFWPQEGEIESSGYCQLPTEITQPEPD